MLNWIYPTNQVLQDRSHDECVLNQYCTLCPTLQRFNSCFGWVTIKLILYTSFVYYGVLVHLGNIGRPRVG